MKILVTGTPGVGKTTLSQHISRELGIPTINVSDFIEKRGLHIRRSRKYDTLVYDPKKIRRELERELAEESFVVDTHDPEIVSFVQFDLIVLLRMRCSVLAKRYKERGYSEAKIRENLEAEIMEVVYNDVIDWLCKDSGEVERICIVEGEVAGKMATTEEIFLLVKERAGCRDRLLNVK
jgi:adenylate kinase